MKHFYGHGYAWKQCWSKKNEKKLITSLCRQQGGTKWRWQGSG